MAKTTWNPSGTVNTFRVHLTDQEDPIVVRNSIGDVIAWEKANKMPWQEGVSASSMLWVAWRAARREGLTNETNFELFVPRVADFEMEVKAADDEDPTQTDPSAG